MLLSPDGKILRFLDSRNGLPLNSVYSIMEDPAGYIWCTTADGIYRLERSGAVTLFDRRSGLSESVISVGVVGERIFLGTGSGVLQLTPDAERGARLSPVPAAGEGYRFLQPHRSGLLLGRHGGADFYNGESLSTIYSLAANGVVGIFPSRLSPDRYWLTESHTLTRVEVLPDGRFPYSHIAIPTDYPLGGIHEDTAGGLWFGTAGQGMFVHDPATGTIQAVRDPETGEPFKGYVGLDNSGASLVVFANGKFLQATPDGTGLHVLKKIPAIQSSLIRALADGEHFLTAFKRVGSSGTSTWGQGLGLLTLGPNGRTEWHEFELPALDTIGFIQECEFSV